MTTFATLLFSKNTPQLQLQGMDVTIDVLTNGNIFYQDPENNVLLIDFKEVNRKISSVKVTKADQILMEDRVEDLSENSIYEINLNNYEEGAYTVTLVTFAAEEISEEFTIY